MVDVWMDWEFIENGQTIEPISVGLVRDDGAEYYAVFRDMPVDRITQHKWLTENVWVHLPLKETIGSEWDKNTYYTLDVSHPDVKPKEQVRTEVEDFLLENVTPTDPLHLWGWFCAYDHVLLAFLFGTMMDLPHGVPMYTGDVRQLVDEYHVRKVPSQIGGVHNALEDAKHIKVMYDYIRENYRRR